jgi:hypothetical protein
MMKFSREEAGDAGSETLSKAAESYMHLLAIRLQRAAVALRRLAEPYNAPS